MPYYQVGDDQFVRCSKKIAAEKYADAVEISVNAVPPPPRPKESVRYLVENVVVSVHPGTIGEELLFQLFTPRRVATVDAGRMNKIAGEIATGKADLTKIVNVVMKAQMSLNSTKEADSGDEHDELDERDDGGNGGGGSDAMDESE